MNKEVQPNEYQTDSGGFYYRDTPYGISRPIHFESLQMVPDHTVFAANREANRERVKTKVFAYTNRATPRGQETPILNKRPRGNGRAITDPAERTRRGLPPLTPQRRPS